MALYYNSTNVAQSKGVYFNSQASKQVYHNGNRVWVHEIDLWNNGATSASGTWTNYPMANVAGQWNLGTVIGSNNYTSNTHFGTLCHTGNKIAVKTNDVFSFYFSGTGSNTTKDTGGFLWNINVRMLLLASPPANPLPFGNLDATGLITAPGKDIFKSGDQHSDWTYNWPVNNTTISYTSTVTGSYYVGFLLWGYNANCNLININSFKHTPS